jgi:hypothetical protein
MAKKSFAWNFPRPKQWQKKAWLKFSSTRKRCVCRPYDSHLVLDLKLLRELAARVAVSNPPTSARWHRMEQW